MALSLPGYLLFRDFAFNQAEEAKPLMEFYEEVRWGHPSGRTPVFMRKVGVVPTGPTDMVPKACRVPKGDGAQGARR